MSVLTFKGAQTLKLIQLGRAKGQKMCLANNFVNLFNETL